MDTQVGQTLTKLILNNKIVQMRKNVRRSRVHIISKLSREIKKLESKQGTDEQKRKNTRKARRFVEQISLMKKIPDDEISKFALTNEKLLLEILNAENELPRNKALARLISDKCISDEVKKFRETYADWKILLEPLLSSLGEKYKNKKPKQNNISSKKSKSSNSLFKKTLNLTAKRNRDESSKSIVIQSFSGTWLVENMERDPVQDIKNILNERNVEKLERKEVNQVEVLVEKPSSIVSTTKSTYPKNKYKANIKMCDTAADPFFLTKNNEEYLSISMKEMLNRVDKNIIGGFDNVAMNKSLENVLNQTFSKSNRHEKNNTKNDFRKESPTLHPSWKAKKNPLNSGMLQTKQNTGKKVKFDIDD